MKKTMKSEEKIFRAAMATFISKGRYGAKMQEIADKAEINKAMLFYYFENKEGLYKFVFQTVLKKLFGSLHTIFKDEIPFSLSLRLFIDQYIDMLNANPALPMFVMRELGEGNETAVALIDEAVREGQLSLISVFLHSAQRAVTKGEIKKVNPIQLLISVMGASNYFFIAEPLLKPFLGNDFNRIEFLPKRKHDVFDLVYNGIKV